MSLTKASYSMITGAPANVKDFGAIGDGTTNDTSAIQAALTSSNAVYFPAGTYLSDTVNLKSNQFVFGDGKSSIIKQNTITDGSYGTLFADSGSASAYISGITIQNIQVLGQVATLGFSEFQHLISLNGVQDVLIDNVYITGFRGDGIYIGCSTVAGRERHNKNVRVTNCVIDGVNNDNRNGISVIDGDGISITNNKFLNCTRTNMPGAIDFEPDGSDAWHIMKNCTVSGNLFDSCGGNVATVGAFLSGSAGWTVKPTNFVISNNTTINPIAGGSSSSFASIIFGSTGASSPGDVIITGNTAFSAKPFDLRQVNGVIISNNVFNQTDIGFIGFNATDTQKNITVTGNVFIGDNTNPSLVTRGIASDIIFSGNTFTNFLNYGLGVSGASSNVSSVIVTGNTFRNITGTALSVSNNGGTLDGASCLYFNNTWSGTHSFPAWRTDDTGNVVQSFSSSTLPDSFPYGVSVAAINGDTGVPSTGAYQGVITNYAQTSLAEKYRYQTYNIANNSTALGTTYIRRRSNSANTWTAWYTITGV